MKVFLIFLVLGIFLCICVLLYWAASDQMYKFWEIVRMPKRRVLERDMDNISKVMNSLEEIDDRIYENKQASFSFNKFKNAIKNSWDLSSVKGIGRSQFLTAKQHYGDYIRFCNEKELSLIETEKNFADTLEELEDILYPDTVVDRKLQKEKEIYDKSYKQMNAMGTKLHCLREKAAQAIAQTNSLIDSMENIPDELKSELLVMNDNRDSFRNKIEYAEKNYKNTPNPALLTGMGITAGATIAIAAPKVAMWVATTFGTASTGVAISSLSGAAATNAATAWIGGGAISAGGGGMAAGNALLALAGPIGIGVAGYFIFKAWESKKEKEELIRRKWQDLSTLKNCTSSLNELSISIDKMIHDTEFMRESVNEQLYSNNSLHNRNYDSLTRLQKSSLHGLLTSSRRLACLINQDVCVE